MPASPGEQIGRYTIETILGAGAMATVYGVVHDTLDTKHAMKVLRGGGPGLHKRLIIEGKVQAALRHPNAVAVTDVLEYEGKPVLLMELVEGPDLDELLKVHQPDLTEALAIFGGILAGLRSAHQRSIIHRDLKPGNVIMGVDPRQITPKVADFGLAKALDSSQDGRQTKAGTTMGTPAYMAPEQISDASTADNRADIFSLGCILYQLVTGKECFQGDSIFSIFAKIATADYQPVCEINPDVPDNVIAAITGALVLDRAERFQTCDEMAKVLFGDTDGFRTTIKIDTPLGMATAQLWDEQQQAALELAGETTRSLPTIPPEVTFEVESESESDLASVPMTTSVAPTATGFGALFYGGLSVVTVMLMVGILGGAGVLVWTMGGGAPTPSDAPTTVSVDAKIRATENADADPVKTPPVSIDQPSEVEPIEAETAKKVAPVRIVHTQKKTPTEAVVRTPTPVEEVLVLVPVPTSGTFKVTGDAEEAVLMDSSGERYAAGGDVPPGNYTIMATFQGVESKAGNAHIAVGRTVMFKCSSMMGGRCVVQR